jgi:hypothetical protein
MTILSRGQYEPENNTRTHMMTKQMKTKLHYIFGWRTLYYITSLVEHYVTFWLSITLHLWLKNITLHYIFGWTLRYILVEHYVTSLVEEHFVTDYYIFSYITFLVEEQYITIHLWLQHTTSSVTLHLLVTETLRYMLSLSSTETLPNQGLLGKALLLQNFIILWSWY